MNYFIKNIKKLLIGMLSSTLIFVCSTYSTTAAVKIDENDQILNCITSKQIFDLFDLASSNMMSNKDLLSEFCCAVNFGSSYLNFISPKPYVGERWTNHHSGVSIPGAHQDEVFNFFLIYVRDILIPIYTDKENNKLVRDKAGALLTLIGNKSIGLLLNLRTNERIRPNGMRYEAHDDLEELVYHLYILKKQPGCDLKFKSDETFNL